MSNLPNTTGSSITPTSTTTSTNSTPNLTVSADNDLRIYVEDMLHIDKRFVGMSRYVFNINFYWSRSIKTTCAGHGFIFFNPDFWDQLSEEKKKTTIAHEIWHLILDHLDRGEGFDPESYNIAADHVINNGLKDDGFVMGEDEMFGDIKPCCDPKYRGMSTNQVYQAVHQERKNDPNSQSSPDGTPTKDQIEELIKDALDGTGKDLAQQADEDEELRSQVVDKANEPGDETGTTQRLLETANVKVYVQTATYAEIFKEYLTDPLSGGKRTFMHPSRRQTTGGLRLKGKYPKKSKLNRLTHLVYALDVSGSITPHQAQQFLRSAVTLKETLKPQLMTVMLWDTSIKFEKVFGEHEPIGKIQVTAGGGTCLDPVYKRVAQINPEALVIFTDLCVDIPKQPSWETIWFVPEDGFQGYMDQYLQQVTYGNVYLVPEE